MKRSWNKILISVLISIITTFLLWGVFLMDFFGGIWREGGYYPSAEKASWIDGPCLLLTLLTFVLTMILSSFLLNKMTK